MTTVKKLVPVLLLFLMGSSHACSRPRCTSIYDRSSHVRSDGKAPLYNDESDGNEYIVVLEEDEDPEDMKKKVDDTRSSANKRIAESSSINGSAEGVNAVISNLNKEELDQVRRMAGVKYVEKTVIIEQSVRTSVWGLDRIDERYRPLDGYYSPTGNGNGVTVYVVDSGVNTQHYLFRGRATNWYQAVSGRGQDCTGHGTHVAGTIAASTYGVATGVNIRSVRVFGCGSSNSGIVVRALNHILRYGRRGSVVNLSLGGSISTVVDDAVKRLIRGGFVVVVAAGNRNTNACNMSPARVTEAITVGATTSTDRRASYSNYGSGVDIFAPGHFVRSLSHTSNYRTTVKSGTSMSAPHVAGVAAILRSRGVAASQVRRTIINLSTKNVVRDPKGSNNRLLYIN